MPIDQALAEWLKEFPALGQSALGRTFGDFRRQFPEWGEASVTRLSDFYESPDYRQLGPQFQARLAELTRTWKAG